MFKKIFALPLFFSLFLLISLFPQPAQADATRDAEANQIAQSIGVTPGAWFSNTDHTMSTIKDGLLLIENQQNILKSNGSSEEAMTAQKTLSVNMLKTYAEATNINDNTNKLNSLFKSQSTLDLEKSNLFQSQSAFYQSLQLGYKKAGLGEEAKIGSDVIKELDKKAAVAYSESQPAANVVTIPSSSAPAAAPSSGLTGIPAAGGTYTLLARIDAFWPNGTVDVKGGGLSGYLQGLYRAGIAIATGLALIMIVVGGLEYVSTDSIQGKSSGKDRIQNAILGLLLALTSYIILQQVNPNLLKSNLQVADTQSVGGITGSAVKLASEDVVAAPALSNYPYAQGLVNNALYAGGVSGIGGNCKPGTHGINTSGSKITPQNIPNMNWSAYALDLINKSRLPNTRPSDAAQYFQGGQITANGWLLILGGMMACETTGFNPTETYQEPYKDKNGKIIGPGTLSVGLLQMSIQDPEASRKGYTNNDLKDPYKNLEVGIGRLESLVLRDGCITCWTGPTGWRGGSAYWSVLQNK
jgi:hypothetical protein